MARLPSTAYNQLTLAGAILAALSFGLMIVLLVASIMMDISSPYWGIFLYMVLPPFTVVGLLLIPLGMIRKWRQQKRGEVEKAPRWPYVDMNKRSHRNAVFAFIVVTTLLIVVGSVGSYEAYHYSESVSFCGTTCHTVMEPEFTAYQHSPHARVACTECHVGSGANWYVKSKLSGAYQVYAVIANNFPRPIPTPIQNLRPAQETCEQCHWPRQFFGAQQRQFNHYMYDDENTHWPINMLIKTGGGDPKTGQTAGIHWHMNIGFKVEYIARDEKRQDIPWVRVTDRNTGRITVYHNEDEPLSTEEIASAAPRVMDCMDCHNRPSHIFRSPDYFVDHALLTGRIDGTIPEIKRVAVEAVAEEYAYDDSALTKIANSITSFYRSDYPDFYRENSVLVDEAIEAAQREFSQNIFPEMGVRWESYPNNIGHFQNPGCMRCHAGNLKSEDGLTLTKDCNTCHLILSQGSGEQAQVSSMQEGLEFEHPEDIDGLWQEMGCFECHTGTQP
jgi:hypothetical protein